MTPAAHCEIVLPFAEAIASHNSVVSVQLGYEVIRGVKTRERRGNDTPPLSIC
jgi:hypothetical protein